jgi:hypothetical protein
MDVIDLDVLRPQKRVLKLNSKEIDISFIPCAITWDVDQLVNEINGIIVDNKEAVLEGGEYTKKVFDLSIKLCSLFCEHKYPDMNEKWFRDEVDPVQIKVFVDAIKDALNNSYKGIGVGSKN